MQIKDQPKTEKEKPKEPEIKEVKTTVNLALKKLDKEVKRPKGNIDKVRSKKVDVVKRTIKSSVILKRNCGRLMNHLHQKMQHSVAIKVGEASKLIDAKMSQRSMQQITDMMDKISKKHGFDFYKP